MVRTITVDEKFRITLAPETLTDEIIQNVAMIISTLKNTVPLFRDFGISATFLDRPTIAAESLLIAEIFDAVEMHEPRAEILSVTFERGGEMAGKLMPVVEVNING